MVLKHKKGNFNVDVVYSLVALLGLLTVLASLVAEHGL